MGTGLEATGKARHDSSEETIGGYVLRRWLAQGGMAELYLAQPVDPERAHEVVVLKKVLSQYTQDLQFRQMFAREAELASALRHPNIVEVFDTGGGGEEDCFLAMEYVHGADLARIVRELRDQRLPMPRQHALTIVAGICAGLHHAHEQVDADGQPLGIVHRDVSPANVLVSVQGDVKITDFGVAKALALTSFTQAGTRKGKLSYMSPEQARAEPIDRRADVFAIGCVLYELTTSQRMFRGENELAVMHQLLFRERPRPSDVIPGYPPALEEIVLTATAAEPHQRYATALELQNVLLEFAHRNGLVLSTKAVGAFIRGVVDVPVHPQSDPDYLTGGPIGAPHLPDDATVPDARGSNTYPTRLPVAPPPPGATVPTPVRTMTPVPPGRTIAVPTVARPAPEPGGGTRRAAIATGAWLVTVLAVAAGIALWMSARVPPTTTPPPDPLGVARKPPEAAKPPLPPPPSPRPAPPVLDVVDARAPAPDPQAAEPDPPAPVVAPEAPPSSKSAKATRSHRSKRNKRGKHKSRRHRTTGDDVPVLPADDAPYPSSSRGDAKPNQLPPPPPPPVRPSSTEKNKSPTDTLLPIVDE